jgi:hypothetical protein
MQGFLGRRERPEALATERFNVGNASSSKLPVHAFAYPCQSVVDSSRSVTIMSERQAQVCGMCIPVEGETTTKDPRQFPGVIEVCHYLRSLNPTDQDAIGGELLGGVLY